MFYDFHGINDVISNKLKSNEPFSLVRLDNTSGYVLQCMYRNKPIVQEFFNEPSLFHAGISPPTYDYAFGVVFPKTIEIMKQCDILGFVDVSGEVGKDIDFLSEFGDKPIFSDILILDPGAINGCSPHGAIIDPWTTHLKGKKVLVVSSHVDSINSQADKLDLIWGDKRELIAPFDYVGCVRSPYHKEMDDRQYPNCDTWEDNIEAVKREIDKYDYDVLLAGSTNTSPFFVEHAKQSGKVGIQTGGVVQLFFGLLGQRWDCGNNFYSPWSKCFNEHWIRPLDSDKPRAWNKFGYNLSESFYAYW